MWWLASQVWSLPSWLWKYNLHKLSVCNSSSEVNNQQTWRWHWKISIRCDTKNIGLTMLCKFNGDVPLPAVWSHQVKCFLHQDRYFKYLVGRLYVACLKVLEEYKKSYQGEDLPDFLKWVFCPKNQIQFHSWRMLRFNWTNESRHCCSKMVQKNLLLTIKLLLAITSEYNSKVFKTQTLLHV